MGVKLIAKGKVLVADSVTERRIVEDGEEFEAPSEHDAERLLEAGDAVKPGAKRPPVKK